MFKRPN